MSAAAETANASVTVGHRAPLATTGVIPPNTTWLMNGTWTISDNQEYVLIAQNDGNLVLYQVIGVPPTKQGDTFTGLPLWATDTVAQGAFASFQGDGNYVVYDAEKQPVWASNTNNIHPTALIVQDDGNLVIYKQEPAWATGTN